MKYRKVLLFSLIFILTLCINDVVYGLEGIVNGTSIRVRNGAGTSYKELGMVNLPSIYTILDENKLAPTDNTNADCDYWYKISYNSSEAYICSIYLTIVTDSGTSGGTGDFLKDLQEFPSSYRDKITELHKLYPNATFTALNTGLDFSTVVNSENFIAYSSPKNIARSLIQTSHDGYKSTNSILYDWSTNIWNTNISGGGSNWYAANSDVIAYYIDPRNFLNYNDVFMFLNHGYSNNITYLENAINNILSGSFMANNLTNDGIHTFANTFIEAGKQSGISPYYLAARVIQEIGRSSTRSSFVDGKYNGYYNYYNIDASGSSNLVNAMTRAKSEGWDNDYKAIIGGAKFISDGYVSTGQSTLYLEKWDVVDGGNGYYSHQYMQNIQAPVSEANTLYKTYLENGLTTSSMEFLIPVYTGMTSSTSLPNQGNPNNYLKNLTINGYTIDDFKMDKLDYTYNLSLSTNSVEIGASKVASSSSISGVGTIDISDNSYTHIIKVKAGNGNIKEYKITFTKDESKPISISDYINSNGLVSDGTYLSGISVGTTSDSLSNSLKSNNISITIKDASGNKKSGVIATGDIVTINNGSETKDYTVVIYGDVNGDGNIWPTDYVKIKNYIMGTSSLTGAYKIAADVNRDGNIWPTDYVKIKNYIMGNGQINQ